MTNSAQVIAVLRTSDLLSPQVHIYL